MVQSNDTGFLPMAVAETSFLVDRLGQDCGPTQLGGELTQNSIEAIVRTGEPHVRYRFVVVDSAPLPESATETDGSGQGA